MHGGNRIARGAAVTALPSCARGTAEAGGDVYMILILILILILCTSCSLLALTWLSNQR